MFVLKASKEAEEKKSFLLLVKLFFFSKGMQKMND
jgi:hypothetical protein